MHPLASLARTSPWDKGGARGEVLVIAHGFTVLIVVVMPLTARRCRQDGPLSIPIQKRVPTANRFVPSFLFFQQRWGGGGQQGARTIFASRHTRGQASEGTPLFAKDTHGLCPE